MRMSNRSRPVLLGVLVLGTAIFLGACGNDDPTVQGAGSADEAAGFNEADVTFLQDMVPHHEQAIEMAEMVEGRTERPQLVEMAGNVISSQTAEIEEIDALLEEAGEDDGNDRGGMDMGGMDMGMSQKDMDALMKAEGEGFDKMFSEMMIEHHGAAIEMAKEVLDAGENPAVADMAQGIIDEQQKEIDDLKSWLKEWGL